MVTNSSNRGLQVPTNAGDVGVWGTELIAQVGGIDSILGGTITFPSSTFGTTATPTSSQNQIARFSITGTPASTFQLNLTASNFGIGTWIVQNAVSNSANVQVTPGSSSAGSTVTIPPGVQKLVWSDGNNVLPADTALPLTTAVEFAIDFGGFTPSSGIKGFIEMPFQFTATRWTLIADTANATATWDILKSSFSGVAGSFASVTGSCQPTVTAGRKAQSSTLSAWTTTWNSGDIVEFSLSSPSNFTKMTLSVFGNRVS